MKTLFTLLFILSSNLVIAQSLIVVKNNSEVIDISNKVCVLEDKENKLSIQDVLKDELQSKFVDNDKDYINHGYNNYIIWTKFSIKNTTDKDIYLKITEPYISLAEIYIPEGSIDNFKVKKLGSSLPSENKEIANNYFITHLISSKDTSTHTFYIRFHHESDCKIILNISTLENFYSEDYYTHLFYGTFIGLIFIMSFYNLFIYFSVKENVYLYYVLSTLGAGLANMIISGYAFDLFWRNYPQLNLYADFYLSGVPILFFIVFSCSFLETYKYSPRGHKGILVLGFILLINLFVVAFDEKIGELIARILVVIICVYLFIIAIRVYIKGNKIARFYIIADSFLLIGIIVYILKTLRFVPVNFFTTNSTLFGTVFDTLFFSLAMADKINILNREKHDAQLENLKLIQEQKETLEIEVNRRTIEIETQNEELHQQKEELSIINEYLEKSQEKIKAQNKELAQKQLKMISQNEKLYQQKKEIVSLNTNLESLVSQRTEELRQTLDNLTKQNQDLSQFSYIISHNLRAPVARILGLVNIFNEKDYNDDFNKQIISHLKQTSVDLDTVIKDLTQIISIRNDLSKTKEEIDILEVINVQKFLLKDEIEKSKAVIDTELVSIKSIHSIKGYVQSILYNLLSNAIKYKSDKRSPIIKLKTEIVDDFVCLSVQDNGLGIDLTTTDTYKIFGLYQRMHNHVDGKGLGLFLVKTQIESMGGRIEIESQLDVGTTFKVYFPNVVNGRRP